MRKGIAIASAIAAVLLVAGCTPKFDGPIRGKQISDTKVQIKFKICVRSTAKGQENECAPPPARAARGEEDIRHTLAFRVPKGTDAPDRFRSRGGEVSYKLNRSYGRELKRLAPTPEGTKWFGYVSGAINDADGTRARYRIRFGLPNHPGNVFKHRPVTGAAGLKSRDSQVNCGDDLFDPANDGTPNTICVTDPTKRKRVRRSLRIELD